MEFRQWLHKHQRHLRAYAPDEIAYIAVLAGFNLAEVCGNVTDQVVHIKRLLNFWESPLMGQWLDLVTYEHGLDD